MRTPWRALALLGTCSFMAACAAGQGAWDFVRGHAGASSAAQKAYALDALSPEARGAVRLALHDWGALNTDTLQTHAVPWLLTATALADSSDGEADAIRSRMESFGFLYPSRIANWPQSAGPQPRFKDAPLGLVTGTATRGIPPIELTIANLGCAACHAGPVWDAAGKRTGEVWLGAPNPDLDLESYTDAVYRALKARIGPDDAQALGGIGRLFPDASATELETLRAFALPQARLRLAALEAAGDRALPFINGAPGLTNGVAALKMKLGTLPDGPAAMGERGFTSIPDLHDRSWRTSLLYDGSYAVPGTPDRSLAATDLTPEHVRGLAHLTAFFIVPSMGVAPDRVAKEYAAAEDVFAFLASSRPQAWPGPLDAGQVAAGAAVYARACASCHGVIGPDGRLARFPNHVAPFNSDPARASAFDPALAAAVGRTAAYRGAVEVRQGRGYAAPPLTGLWQSAPYMHNGSVPTLRQYLLLEPRTASFRVGGHDLDMAAVGIGAGGRSLRDTREPGLANQGHEAQFEALPRADREALLEYLKTL